MGVIWLNTSHHYLDHGIFYQGALPDGRRVALTRWKVEVVDRHGQSVRLYQKSAVFQEKVPHQPKVEIRGNHIQIDDGEDKLVILLQQTSADAP
jgi:hypothetical protein